MRPVPELKDGGPDEPAGYNALERLGALGDPVTAEKIRRYDAIIGRVQATFPGGKMNVEIAGVVGAYFRRFTDHEPPRPS